MTDTVETVTFKLANGVTKDEFIAANVAMTQWTARQKGFQYRSLSQFEDGSWMDIVYWASKADADAADAKFKAEMMSSDFCVMIDPNSVAMKHSSIQSQNMAEQAA